MSIFSGRTDPSWAVGPDVVARAQELWNSLVPAPATRATPPALGYRGCVLELPDGSGWSVFGGVVTRQVGGAGERRMDPGRVFERLLIESAPAGTIPAGALASIGLA